jgi:thiol-disulfide isomerase/thioredoxin
MATKEAAEANRRAASARAEADAAGRSTGSWLLIIGVVVVAVAAAVAMTVSVLDDGDGRVATVEDRAEPVAIDGESLPPAVDGGPDPAIGQPFPSLRGTGIDGDPTAIAPGEEPLLVIYLAHWCPVCQEEVPVVRDWIAAGGAEGVAVVAVSTDLAPERGNWPSSRWLAGEAWLQPTLIDPDGAAGAAAGKQAVPYFVAVDADGQVAARATGALAVPELDALASAARGD